MGLLIWDLMILGAITGYNFRQKGLHHGKSLIKVTYLLGRLYVTGADRCYPVAYLH